MIKIEIKEICNGCGICAAKCPTAVFEIVDKKSSASNLNECMACRLCEVVCPLKGITVIES